MGDQPVAAVRAAVRVAVRAVVLAGGRARRMGGGPGGTPDGAPGFAPAFDKGRLDLGGISLIGAVLARIGPQVTGICLSANGDPARFADLGLPVLPDPVPDLPGPLAGVLAAMEHAAALGESHVLSVPADTPFLPLDLVSGLQAALRADPAARIAMAAAQDEEGGEQEPRPQPVCALWPVDLRADLRRALQAGARKVTDWARPHGIAFAPFPRMAFFNVNTPEDLVEARALHRSAAMRVFGVTGRKNSGKTTLVEGLLREFTARGLVVNSVKHTHHPVDVDQPGRDSHRHRAAGAAEVLLVGPLTWALMHRRAPGEADQARALPGLLARMGPADLVLVEGYRQGSHPKIELWRRATGEPRLDPAPPGLCALASDQGDGGSGLPVIAPDDPAAIADFILTRIGLRP